VSDAEAVQDPAQPLPSLHRNPLPDASPPESYRSLAAEYPWLTLAAGAGVGLLVGALIPRRITGKLGQRAAAAATWAGEVGMALAPQAGITKIAEGAGQLRERAGRSAGLARSAGTTLAREAIKLALKARK